MKNIQPGVISNSLSITTTLDLKTARDLQEKVDNNQAIDLNPDSISVLKSLAEIQIKQECWHEAAKLYQYIINFESQDHQIYFQLAKCFEKLNKLPEAIEVYQQVITFKPDVPARFHILIGRIFQKQACWQEAINCYQKAQQVNPDLNDSFYLNLKHLQLEQGDLEQAVTTAKLWTERNYLINHQYKIIYCPIPKNACTLLKMAILEHSHELAKYEQSDRHIHGYIKANYAEVKLTNFAYLERPDYFKFVILRDPFKRLVSAYLNKFVKPRKPSPIVKDVIKEVYEYSGKEADYEKSITFTEFVNYLARTEDYNLNSHWRPQHTFLGQDLFKFDLIGQLENLEAAIKIIEERTGLKIKNEKTKNMTNYRVATNNEKFHEQSPQELRLLKVFPTATQFYTPELKQLVAIKYAEDLKIYEREFA